MLVVVKPETQKVNFRNSEYVWRMHIASGFLSAHFKIK